MDDGPQVRRRVVRRDLGHRDCAQDGGLFGLARGLERAPGRGPGRGLRRGPGRGLVGGLGDVGDVDAHAALEDDGPRVVARVA
eukprot:5843475-Pleurochrysis_carterae.AAC.1